MAGIQSGDDLIPYVEKLENSPDTAVSPAGALGRYQIEPQTARQYGYDPAKLSDPTYGKQAASTILNDLYKRFNGDDQAVLAAYNAGPTVAHRFVASGKDVSTLPRETQGYLQRYSKMAPPPDDNGAVTMPFAPYAGPPPLPPIADVTNPADEAAAQKTTDMWRKSAGMRQGQPLPPILQSMAAARAHGYSWEQIDSFVSQKRDAAKAAGYTDAQINNYFAGAPLDNSYGLGTPVKPEVEGNAMAEIGAGLRNFSERWFGESDPFRAAGLPVPGWKPTAGQILKDFGWSSWDFAKSFFGSAVNGMAATAEMFDGKQRTPWEWAKQGWEAGQFLSLFVKAPPEAAGAKKEMGAAFKFPTEREALDGSVAVANAHPAGYSPENVQKAARVLGENFVNNGEHPVDAAARAHDEPAAMRDFHDRMDSVKEEDFTGMRMPTEEPAFKRMQALHGENQEAMAGRDILTRRFQDMEDAKRGAGARPEDPATAMAGDLAAGDKLVPPGQIADPTPRAVPFSEMMADQGGAISLPRMPAIAPEQLFQPDPEMAEGLVHDIKAIVAPWKLAPNAAEAISEGRARSTIQTERAVGNLLRFGRAIGELDTPTRWQYIHAIEARQLGPYQGTTLGALGQQLRAELDHAWDLMDARGIAPHYVEDYLPHMYQDANGYRQWMQTRRPLAGGKAFTKERVFGSYAEAMDAGLTPATDNPITMTAVALRQMYKYIAAHDTVENFKASGVIQTIAPTGRVPPGLSRINGQLGVAKGGNLYAPNDVAMLLNRATDPGIGNSSLYGMVRGFGNNMIQMSLLGPGFHSTFVTLDAMTSQIALATQQLSRGTWEGLAKAPLTLAQMPIAPFKNAYMGWRMRNILLGRSVGTPVEQTIADRFIAGGGRIRMGDEYRGSAYGDFLNAFRGTFVPGSGYATLSQEIAQTIRDAPPFKFYGTTVAPGIARAGFQLIARTMDTIAAPLMQHAVPMMKMGTFASKMRDAMSLNPNMGMAESRHIAAMLNRHVDNVLGEMVYDNRFWPVIGRQIAHLGVRALGWYAGDIAAVPGGIAELAKGRSMQIGQYRQIGFNAAYVLALPVATAMMGAVYGYMHGTWNENWSPIDYMFPPTGGTDAKGNPERVSLPTYVKDVHEMATHPVEWAENKVAPLWTTIYDLMTNRDYYGGVIANTRDEDAFTNIEDYAKWFAEQYEPLSVKSLQPEAGAETGIPPIERLFGMRPAPWAVQNPQQEEKWENRNQKEAIKKREKERAKGQR